MINFHVYIDDSGSPGQSPANNFQAINTKIWAALILSHDEKQFIDQGIEFIKSLISKELSFSEFHFTEIYSGKKAFKGVDYKLRLAIFQAFAYLYNCMKPCVLVTGAGEDTLKNTGFSDSYINKKDDGFHNANPSDYALKTLLSLINERIVDVCKADNIKEDNIVVEITIDEGRKKANTSQRVYHLGVCKELNYQSSINVYGLQFIDFIVFCINRIQNNFSKYRSDFDNEFMRIVGSMQLKTNLEMITINENNFKELNQEFVESKMGSQGKPSNEQVRYLEKLEQFEKKIRAGTYDKSEILKDSKELKQSYSKFMTNEFKDILDKVDKM